MFFIISVPDIHDLLGPYDRSIGNLDLVPKQVQRIRLFNGRKNLPGFLREILTEESIFLCIFVSWRSCGIVIARLSAPFSFSQRCVFHLQRCNPISVYSSSFGLSPPGFSEDLKFQLVFCLLGTDLWPVPFWHLALWPCTTTSHSCLFFGL